MESSQYVCVPIHRSTYNEFILRKGEDCDVASWIQNIVDDFLDRTSDDVMIWSAEYLKKIGEHEAVSTLSQYGPATEGYWWQHIFLPNGTKLTMNYKGREHWAEIRHSNIYFGDQRVSSPSALASTIAENTSRNAWRDIRIQFPGETHAILADKVRASISPSNRVRLIAIRDPMRRARLAERIRRDGEST